MKRLVLIPLVCLLFGCSPSAPTTTDTTASNAASESGHSHEHGDLGPHGGHLLDLQPAGKHAEWTHDDEKHLIAVYLDDFDAEKVQEVKFVVDLEGVPQEEFPLTAGEQGWSITSEALMTHLNMGDVVKVQLLVIDDSGTQASVLEKHEDHHH